MKILVRIIQLILLGFLVYGCSSIFTNKKQMSFDDIVSLSQAKVSDYVIASEISATRSKFDLTTEDIQILKSKGVSDNVILYMIKSDNPGFADFQPQWWYYDLKGSRYDPNFIDIFSVPRYESEASDTPPYKNSLENQPKTDNRFPAEK